MQPDFHHGLLRHQRLSETQHESTRDHDIVHVVVRGDDREIPRTCIVVADFAAECEPSNAEHIVISRIRVSLMKAGAPRSP